MSELQDTWKGSKAREDMEGVPIGGWRGVAENVARIQEPAVGYFSGQDIPTTCTTTLLYIKQVIQLLKRPSHQIKICSEEA
jgi:hypothetical protein